MKLKVLLPDSGLTQDEIELRRNRLMSVASADTAIDFECQTDTTVCVDFYTDIYVTAPELIQKAVKAEKDGFDAVGIYCGDDPAIQACREMLTIPVIGAGQSSLQVAIGLGATFSWITGNKAARPLTDNFIRLSGVDYTRLASIGVVEIDIEAQRKQDSMGLMERLAAEGRRCIEEDGAHVLVLGCLSFAGLGPGLSETLGIPVVDPAFTLVGMAELLHKQHLAHSKLTFPRPPAAARVWKGGSL